MNVTWHKWPDEKPPTAGLYWVFCPALREYGANDTHVCFYTGGRRWRAIFHEDTDETNCVHSWAAIEYPEPPRYQHKIEQRWFIDGRQVTYDEAMSEIERDNRRDA
jgi:hypothetical protein